MQQKGNLNQVKMLFKITLNASLNKYASYKHTT